MYLKLGFLALSLSMTLIIFLFGSKAIDFCEDQHKPKKKILLGLSLLTWHIYVFLIVKSGIIKSFELPPRFPLLLVMPTFIIMGAFLYSNRNKEWIKAIPNHWLAYVQSFRIAVETLFVFAVVEGILHWQVTIHGYNYDMFVGISALVVGLLIQKKLISNKLAIAWNISGLLILAVVVFTFVTTSFIPSLWGSDVPLLPMKALAYYPFALVAGFLMPVAVFLHIWSIMQLSKRD